jgi:hypothetical protein
MTKSQWAGIDYEKHTKDALHVILALAEELQLPEFCCGFNK